MLQKIFKLALIKAQDYCLTSSAYHKVSLTFVSSSSYDRKIEIAKKITNYQGKGFCGWAFLTSATLVT
jgi:hypothetical protein